MLRRFGKVINYRKKALAVILATLGLTTACVMAGLFTAIPVCAAEKAVPAELETGPD
jgi:phosphohistidine swiveling domain-containing protein